MWGIERARACERARSCLKQLASRGEALSYLSQLKQSRAGHFLSQVLKAAAASHEKQQHAQQAYQGFYGKMLAGKAISTVSLDVEDHDVDL